MDKYMYVYIYIYYKTLNNFVFICNTKRGSSRKLESYSNNSHDSYSFVN